MSKEKIGTTCEHGERKEVITATTVEIKCSGCKEVVHERKRVLSSNIYAVGRIGRRTEIQFMNTQKGPGKVYVSVQDVPKTLHNEFLKSKSKGQFHNEFLKNDFEWLEVRWNEENFQFYSFI